jgi:uncharacterized membrane protein YtjA (UPF0391 family)
VWAAFRRATRGRVPRAHSGVGRRTEEGFVLNWAITFFIVAIVAALFGFSGIPAAAAEIAQVLFVLFLVLFAVSLLAGLRRR